jgi:aspartyl-tRNA(Asn)/glutamyl-tRNA(Gln) amidotransferase subunit C
MPAENVCEIDVAHVARLARLKLTAEETELFQKQLERVLEYAAKLREADTTRVDAGLAGDPLFDVLREDQPRNWFNATEALSNAPLKANDLFIVPKVVE